MIEVAAIVYDLAYGPIESYASLIRSPVPNHAEGVNGIRAEALADAPGPDDVWQLGFPVKEVAA